MATAVFTPVESRVNQVLTNAIWQDEVQDNINQLASAHRNLLVNGGMEIWQRGNTFSSAGSYTADRWQLTVIAGSVSQETTTVDAASAGAAKFVATGTCRLVQKLEGYVQLQGKTLSLSVRARQGVANNVRIGISEDATTWTYSATSATTGAYVTLTVSRAIGAGATAVYVGIELNATDTAYADNAMLVIGPAPAPYQPLTPQEDLARCQRYYEFHGGASGVFPDLTQYASAAAEVHRHSYMWHVQKGGAPTVTKNGTWAVLNCGQPSVGFSTVNGYTLAASATAAGLMSFSPNSTDDYITGEWNP